MFFPTGRATAQRGRSCSLHLLFIMLLLAPFSLTYGQRSGSDSTGTGGKHVIQGRIYFPSGRGADARVQVKLQSLNSGEITVLADGNGSFSFRGLSPGNYTVVIEGGDDYETSKESVFIDTEAVIERANIAPPPISRPYTVMFYLQPKRNSGTAGATKPGVLNAALANVPAPARDLFNKAAASIQAGQTKNAIEQLRGAISYYPEFALAYNELGVQYLKLGQVGHAVEALRAAVKYAPDSFSPRLNYGIALLEKKDFAEAEAQLRQALKRNDASPSAHLYLGITLLSLRRLNEAEIELQKAVKFNGGQMSLAHYYLGGIYWEKKDYKRAADELEMYLKLVPKAANADKIRATIKSLREKS